jgi:hypothetical protein
MQLPVLENKVAITFSWGFSGATLLFAQDTAVFNKGIRHIW